MHQVRGSRADIQKVIRAAEQKRDLRIILTGDNDAKVLESRVGVASYYSDKFEGRKTSNGEVFSQDKLTAAHPSYSFGTIVRVKNLKNRKTVIVRINDRMTNLNGRIIDLSKKAAEELDMVTSGIAKVQVDVLSWGDSH